MRDTLTRGLAQLGLSDHALPQLEAYAALLLEKNRVMNLTAITDPQEVATLHLLDCAALLTMADLRGKQVIDVGTGAGFPGMVLRILEPDFDLTLLDSLGKRVDFLREVCAALSLQRVDCVHARAEEFAAGHRQQYDAAASRAVANLNLLCELTLPLVKVGGQFLAMKSVSSDEEIQGARGAIGQLGGRIADIRDYTVPETQVRHRLVVIEKVKDTPAIYPRSFARMKKAPLKYRHHSERRVTWERSSPSSPARAAPAKHPSPPTPDWRWPLWASTFCAWTATSPCGIWIWRWDSATGH